LAVSSARTDIAWTAMRIDISFMVGSFLSWFG
jgi:hypothetical protein